MGYTNNFIYIGSAGIWGSKFLISIFLGFSVKFWLEIFVDICILGITSNFDYLYGLFL